MPARLWYLPLIGAGAGATIALRAADARHGVLVALFATVLLALVGTDLERHLLPNRVIDPALAVALALCWAWPDRSAVSSLAGGLTALLVMAVAFLLAPGFGLGDVKLATLLGLLSGLSNALPALMVGMIAGGLGATLLLVAGRARMTSAMAYGPYLALGAFVGMLAQ